ncbi:glyceraldehyde 3-phosphate dehydrogenase [Sulfitobacter brevis]|uniref:Glyceraldehyde 3-phosphate dehydrogenase n=1 Tax=Sulfitobacter brevis TaxID=74348 RepID=A0A1I2E6B1_9RHOB|nr:glyceraldehyde 3-phosphate dehydrogenase NAD-binding domain-containing protein [Sulfitobacter brevis]SFE88375.1 glyceraldehyde 3-phosphate dehydrogenase [Sulfitobacter brevis]
MRIAINGFGRIGRTVLRQILSEPAQADVTIALINDIAPLETCAYLLKYDSTYGPLPADVKIDGSALRIGASRVPFSHASDITGTDLSGVDVLLECTGKLTSRAMAERGLAAGARAVLISGPSAFADVTVVTGANDAALGDARIVSNSSCTTNAIAPLLRAINAAAQIERAHVTTIHCYTASQPMVDAARGDLARSRAGAESMVPTTTSAAQELTQILPEIGARTSVAAVRVPCLSVSAIDATLQFKAALTIAPEAFLESIAAQSRVIGSLNDPCVSRDLRGRPESLILALPETLAMGQHQLRVFGWYDNEWGFSARMVDMARRLAKRADSPREGA